MVDLSKFRVPLKMNLDREELMEMLRLAEKGTVELRAIQRAALAGEL